MRQSDGSFSMHEGGESDTRSLYCAVSVASLTGMLENVEDSLFVNSAQFIVRYVEIPSGSAMHLLPAFRGLKVL